jgi:uncharacterized protein UPF0547
MGSLSIWYWIVILVVLGLIARILTRTKKKACPKCAEKIKAAALVCRFCGYEFPKSP